MAILTGSIDRVTVPSIEIPVECATPPSSLSDVNECCFCGLEKNCGCNDEIIMASNIHCCRDPLCGCDCGVLDCGCIDTCCGLCGMRDIGWYR